MPRVDRDIRTTAPPEKVVAALLDFSETRPQTWPGISAEHYEVLRQGDTWADVREGTKGPGVDVWAVEHYDWSDPGVVQWTVTESNFSAPGSYVRAKVVTDGSGGSIIHLTWNREGLNFKGKAMVRLIKLLRGGPVVSSMQKGLRRLEQNA
ncbi:MAG TPA: SRPBCC family protein [Actinomycetota bacterium]|nr:SRPBCC family protein [Actinomycetota bacterium]